MSFFEMVTNFSGRYREKLKRLSEPLLQTFGINYFYYIHLSPDNKASFIGTIPDLLADYLDRGMEKYNPFFKHSQALSSGVCLYDAVQHERFQESMNYLMTKYDTKHCCILAKRNDDGVGIYGFSVPHKSAGNGMILINQIPLLRQFTAYFEEEMDHILQNLRAHSLEMTFDSNVASVPQLQLEEKEIREFLGKIACFDKMPLAKFTKREMECIALLLSGKTAVEIAKAQHLSPRTIEHRIEALKDKLDCPTKSALIQRLQKLKTFTDQISDDFPLLSS